MKIENTIYYTPVFERDEGIGTGFPCESINEVFEALRERNKNLIRPDSAQWIRKEVTTYERVDLDLDETK